MGIEPTISHLGGGRLIHWATRSGIHLALLNTPHRGRIKCSYGFLCELNTRPMAQEAIALPTELRKRSPSVGIEPTTTRLKAGRSTTELRRQSCVNQTHVFPNESDTLSLS